MRQEEILEKVEEMKESKMFLKNILDGAKIDRFKFTEKERLALDFAIDFLNASIDQLV
jgi:hypothetical protein